MEEKKIENGQEYWHISLLSNWEKNNKVRIITSANWLKLLADVKHNGIESPFEIDQDNGNVYDGNNRLKGLNALIDSGVTHADSGQELVWVPVNPKTYTDEVAKWRVALKRNEQFASWNQDELANFAPEFELHIDTSTINLNFNDPLSLGEQIMPDLSKDAPKLPKEKKEVTCPACQEVFTP